MKRKFSLYIKEVIYVYIRSAPYIPNVSKKKENHINKNTYHPI